MKVLEIGSKDNPTFRKYKSLLTSRGIKEHHSFFIMGEKLIHEFLNQKHAHLKVKNVICFDGHEFPLLPSQVKLKKELFDELDVLGTRYPLLVIECKEFDVFNFQEQPQGLEIISPLGDPKNLGALARSSVAFGASKIILTHDSCHPYLPQTIKASAGTILNIPLYVTPFKMNQIPFNGSHVALDLKGSAIGNFKWPKNLRLLLGEEGPGLNLTDDQRKKVQFIHIPTSSTVESLNAAVSASIALWQWKNSN